MIVDTKTKVLAKFGSIETVCVDRRSKKLLTLPLCAYIRDYVHSHTTNFPTICVYIMKLWIMILDTKTKVLAKFGSIETVCVDRRSKKLLKLPLCVYMGLCTLQGEVYIL